MRERLFASKRLDNLYQQFVNEEDARVCKDIDEQACKVVPGIFTAFLVPVRESGSLIPQLVIASFVRRQAVRKWTFVLGSVLQALAVLAMAVIAVTLSSTAAGFGLVAALIVFSLSRG